MISTVIDQERGCGWRKEGGIYLMGGGESIACGRLPLPLERCPTCDHGIKPSRGWTWVDPRALFAAQPCGASELVDRVCPLASHRLMLIERAGLLWIGEAFYRSPADFSAEAGRLGISRRIAAVPKGLEIGKTWVLLAHRKAITVWPGPGLGGPVERPGIFRMFRPDRIEYLVGGGETPEELEALEKRGLTLVKVERAGEPVAALV